MIRQFFYAITWFVRSLHQLKSNWCSVRVAWISSDYFESLLLPQLRGENDSKHSEEIQTSVRVIGVNFSEFLIKGNEI